LQTSKDTPYFLIGLLREILERAGAAGVILNPASSRIHNFAWGLGIASSIQPEALALFQGLNILT